MPFGPYEDFDDCVAQNADKDDPGAYCAAIKEATESSAQRASYEVVDEMEAAPRGRGPMWEGVLAIEGELTGDGRMFTPGAVRWENLPVPLRWVRVDEGEHRGAVVVGRIEQVYRDGAQIRGRGSFDAGSAEGLEAARQVSEGLTPGVSVDLDDVSFEIRVASEILDESELVAADEEEQPEPEGGMRVVMRYKPEDEVMVTTDARLRAATIVATPAFADARIAMADDLENEEEPEYALTFQLDQQERTPTTGMAEDAQRALDWRADGNAGGEQNTVERARSIARREALSEETIRRMHAFFSRNAQYPTMAGFKPGDDGFPSPARVAWGLWGGDGGASWSSKLFERMERRESESALVAGSAPTRPPSSWFADPGLAGPTPLTVTEDGRVYGHLATWGTCHTGYAGQCVEPPPSATNYAYFRTGAIRTAEGPEVAVGRLTLDTNHAGRRLGPSDTAAHYDHTGLAVADVSAGEDVHGIWVAGAMRPGVSEDDVRTLQASPLSGDWRRIGGNLELVAALAVNSPGFPIPRVLVAGGAVQSLQSSGVVAVEPDGLREWAVEADDRAILDRLLERERRVMRTTALAAQRQRTRVLAAVAQSRMRAATRRKRR